MPADGTNAAHCNDWDFGTFYLGSSQIKLYWLAADEKGDQMSLDGTFETCRGPCECLLIGTDRKWPAPGQNDANDPEPTSVQTKRNRFSN
jgi:hypothetical protein